MIFPAEWERAIARIIDEKGTVVLLGAADTGKTTFAFALVKDALAEDIPTALVDADLGQSSIGPPTTIGLTLLRRGDSLENPRIDGLYFVGDTTPFGHLLQSIVGTKLLVQKALETGAELVVVDTSGLISGAMGQALKYHEILIAECKHVVALQRSTELEYVLHSVSNYERPSVYSLLVPIEARRIPPEARARTRRDCFQSYFEGARVFSLSLDRISVYPPIVDLVRRRDFLNLAVGLRDEECETCGIGIIVGQRPRDSSVEILSPVSPEVKIRGLEIGFLRLSQRGEELGRVKLWKSHE